MAAVTASSSHITGCNIWPLANMQYVAAASPAFIARYFGAQGINAQTLSQAPVLTYDRKDAMQDKWLHQQGVSARHAPPRHWVPSAHAFVRACEAGVAWGMHPTVLIREHLANGSLVELLPGHAQGPRIDRLQIAVPRLLGFPDEPPDRLVGTFERLAQLLEDPRQRAEVGRWRVRLQAVGVDGSVEHVLPVG